MMNRMVHRLIAGCLLAGSFSVFAADTREGWQIYEVNCAMCHGNQGISVMVNAPSFKRGEGLFQSDFVISEHVKRGKNACPSYVGMFSDQQILNVIAYLRSFYR